VISEQKKVLKAASSALKRVNAKTHRAVKDEWDFPNWLAKYVTVKKAGKLQQYSFEGFEPFLPIAREMHQYDEQWFLKGTQIAFSTFIIGWSLYLPNWRGLDCGYALPDKVMIKPFMKTRFGKEQIQQNKELRTMYEMHETEMFYSAGPHYVYFLGANVLSETLSRPMDAVMLDEVTIIERKSIDMMQERMDASDFGQLVGFAREIYPGGPADVGYQSGKQNVCLMKCPACNEWQNLEEMFYQSSLAREPHPRCVNQDAAGNWQVVCVKCQKAYERSKSFHWVPKFTDRQIQSYRMPQVIFEGRDLNKIMRRWQKSASRKSKRTELHSSMLAIPDAGDLQRISRDTLIQLKRKYELRKGATWSIGGLDLGNTCYAEFYDFIDDIMRLIWVQEINSDRLEETMAELMVSMNCMMLVSDALPLTTEARRLAYRFPENVTLNFYKGNEVKEDQHEHFGQTYKVISQDREQALDAYCDLFTPELPKIIFPERMIEADGSEVDFEDSTFAIHHLIGSQKDEVDDLRLGKKVFRFKKNVENHYFHAGNYAATAAALLAKYEAQFAGMAPVFGNFSRE
jgi:hypothetical protein